jgi:hypothetical protein
MTCMKGKHRCETKSRISKEGVLGVIEQICRKGRSTTLEVFGEH